VLKFTSLDLQQQTGEIQRAAAQEPVLITNHGKARAVMLSAEEFCRLKEVAGEAVPAEARTRRAVTVRPNEDPLGYDVSVFDAAVRRMSDDVRCGRTDGAVAEELARVRRMFPALQRGSRG
jgi:prevent-host-death family protein